MSNYSECSPPEEPTKSLSDDGQEQNGEEVNIQSCLRKAEELKSEGNDHFRGKRWSEALFAYRCGLGQLPKRREQAAGRIDGEAGESSLPPTQVQDSNVNISNGGQEGDKEEGASNETRAVLDRECAKTRSVMNANIGACYVKLGEHKEAVQACTEALVDDPRYIKALQRRASSNEIVNSWSSLTSAQDDYTTLLNLLPPSSPQFSEVKRTLKYLKPRVEEAQKRETAEMLGKLKGLGNSILGNFGLSTDNFKLEPNGQGGYSMNFTQ